MYTLGITANKTKPPILLNAENNTPIIEGNYVIGSTFFVDNNYKETDPNEATILPDPNWRMYPKSDFPSVLNRFPISYAFTTYEDPSGNGYLFYMPGPSSLSKEYSRMLRKAVLENMKKPEPLYSVSKKKLLEKEIRSSEQKIDRLKEELKKIQTGLTRQKNIDKRSGTKSIEKIEKYERSYEEITNTLKSIKFKISRLKKDLEIYKIKPRVK